MEQEPLMGSPLEDFRSYYTRKALFYQNALNMVDPDIKNSSPYSLQRMIRESKDANLVGRCSYKLHLLSLYNDSLLTITFYEKLIDEKSYIQVESGELDKMGSDGAIKTDVVDENFMDITGADITPVSAGFSVNSQQGQNNMLDMDNFFERPIQIYTYQFTSGDISARIAVWDSWSSAPSVRAKLRNYAYFRGNLKVRIVIAGTPYDFGRMLVSYQPLDTANRTLGTYNAALAITSTIRPAFLCYLSQAPGAVVMNPNENKPVDLTIPFISSKPMHRLFNTTSGTAISAVTSFDDFVGAGALYLYTINSFASSAPSATTTVVTLQVYAWMEDVELGAPTATQIAITTESGSYDERKSGPVERLATQVYTVSEALSRVPGIAPFATATSIASSALRNIASIFGWSKPVLIENIKQFKNQSYANGALTIGNETTKRVVLDPKQELTVDPRALGVADDDMIISRISRVKSYVTTFTWSVSASVFTPLGAIRVTPNLAVRTNRLGVNYFQPAAMQFAAAPFSFWRGDIIFEVEVVCSAFHRGKLMIGWEPNNAQYSILTSAIQLNKQYVKVIDIQQTQTVSFRVNWGAYRSWLMMGKPDNSRYNIEDPGNTIERIGFANGFIYICPFTQLQAPDIDVISINIYAYCENLQVNGFTSLNMPAQRGIITSSGEYGVESTVPVTVLDLNESTATTNTICKEHFGEQPLSFRSLLKRFVTIKHFTVTITTQSSIVLTQPVISDNLMVYGGGTPAYIDLFSYLRYAFVGLRGSYRYRHNINNIVNQGWLCQAKYMLLPPASSASVGIVFSTSAAKALIEGTVMYTPNTNGGLEAEFPMYTNNLFMLSFYDNTPVIGATEDVMNNVWFQYYALNIDSAVAVTNARLEVQVAAGEDFSFLRFQGAPPYSA